LSSNAGHALPNFISDSVFQSLIRKWHAPYAAATIEAFDGIAKEVVHALIDITRKVMPQQLHRFFITKIRGCLKRQEEIAKAQVELSLKIESRVTYTLDTYYVTMLRALQSFAKDEHMSNAQSKAQADEARHPVASPCRALVLELLSDGDATHVGEEIISQIEKRSRSNDPGDQHLLELQMSAICYDRIVRKRLADDLMRLVHHFFVHYIADELGLQLAENCSPEQAHELLKPDVAEAEEHIRLTAKLAACRDGIKRIDEAGCCIEDADSSEELMLSKEDVEIEIVLRSLQGMVCGREAVEDRVRSFFEDFQTACAASLRPFADELLEKVFQTQPPPEHKKAFKVHSLTRAWGKPQVVRRKVVSWVVGRRLHVKSIGADATIEPSRSWSHHHRNYCLRYDDSSSYHVSLWELLEMAS